jgi:hypothetical protein
MSIGARTNSSSKTPLVVYRRQLPINALTGQVPLYPDKLRSGKSLGYSN